MTDQAAAPSGGNDISVVSLPADAPESFSSEHDAAKYFASLHEKKPEKQTAESADDATAEPELSGEDNAAPVEERAHGEDEGADPVAEPPIARPKSWTEADEADWQATPRKQQEKIVARELERDTALRRAQNEAAEKLKGLTAKEQQAEQAKERYEANLPALMQALQDAHSQEFSEIKSMADVERISYAIKAAELANDPLTAMNLSNYLTRWQVHQQKMASVKAELDQAEGQKAQKHQTEWAAHVQKENGLAAEYIPELADKDKGPALTKRAAERLAELGFKQEELNDLASGKERLSLYDHRVQRLIFSDLKLADIQNAKTAVAAKPLPTVPQRPGASKPAGTTQTEKAQALDKSLTNSGDLKDAVALLQARRGRRTA